MSETGPDLEGLSIKNEIKTDFRENMEFDLRKEGQKDRGFCFLDKGWNVLSIDTKILESMGLEGVEQKSVTNFMELLPDRLKDFLKENENEKQISFKSSFFDENDIEHHFDWTLNLYEDRGETRRSINCVDITEISNRANRDFLTGLYNQNFAFNHINKIDSERSKNLTFLIFDVNDLKKVNDGEGHEVGNRLIQGFSRFLKGQFRKNDLVCRIGGDEFLVIMDFSDVIPVEVGGKMVLMNAEDQIEHFKNRVDYFMKNLPEYNTSEGKKQRISVSYGMSKMTDINNRVKEVDERKNEKLELIQDEKLRELFKSADDAMYENKKITKKEQKESNLPEYYI